MLYRSGTGPVWLRATLKDAQSSRWATGKCIYSLSGPAEEIAGNVMLDIDGLVERGDVDDRAHTNEFYKLF